MRFPRLLYIDPFIISDYFSVLIMQCWVFVLGNGLAHHVRAHMCNYTVYTISMFDVLIIGVENMTSAPNMDPVSLSRINGTHENQACSRVLVYT